MRRIRIGRKDHLEVRIFQSRCEQMLPADSEPEDFFARGQLQDLREP